MKYLKLFENFNEPDIEDVKWIIISKLGEILEDKIDPKWNAKNILRFEVNKPTKEQLQSCNEHLNTEGFFLYINRNAPEDSVNILVGIGNSFEEWINNWLNENFGNLKRIEYGTTVYFTEDQNLKEINIYDIPKSVIFFTDPTSKFTKINWNKLWKFLEYDLSLDSAQLKEILKNWIEKTYELKDIPPLDWKNI